MRVVNVVSYMSILDAQFLFSCSVGKYTPTIVGYYLWKQLMSDQDN